MARNATLWVVIGFACGVAVSLSAMAVIPGGWPRAAGAQPAGAPAMPSADEIAQGIIRAMEQRVEPGGDAPTASLQCDLMTLRSQIELYKAQHGDDLPGLTAEGRFDGKLFVGQLVCPTDGRGNVYIGRGRRQDYPYGPYLTRMPSNPFIEGAEAATVAGGAGDVPADGKSGWWFNTVNGSFHANDPNHGSL